MDANEIELLAEAIVRKQTEAAAKKAEEDAKAQAEASAKQAEEAIIAAEAAAVERAKRDAEAARQHRIEEERQQRIEAVLTAKVGDVFVDHAGAEHRVVGVVTEGVDTVSKDKDGGTIGNWRRGRNSDHLSGWTKKA